MFEIGDKVRLRREVYYPPFMVPDRIYKVTKSDNGAIRVGVFVDNWEWWFVDYQFELVKSEYANEEEIC